MLRNVKQMNKKLKMNLHLRLLNAKRFRILNKLTMIADSLKTKMNLLQMLKIPLAINQILNKVKICLMHS